MSLEFKEEQSFRKWWHYIIAGFPLIIISVIFLLVQLDLVQTKNNKKEPLFFIMLILFMTLTFIWFLKKYKTHPIEIGKSHSEYSKE